MITKRLTTVSKFLSKYLRHSPEEIGIELEPDGWVEVEILLSAAARHGFPIDRIELDEVVANCNKKRFSFNDSRNRIKANQGHSTDVDLQFPSAIPPSVLYHGTAERNRDSIFEKGLLKGQRHHVHLTTDIDTARRVGIRYGKPIILVVDTVRMIADGHQFWISENNVWLAETVPPQYLSELAN